MKGICVLTNVQDNISGYIEFTEIEDRKLLEININKKFSIYFSLTLLIPP